MSADVHRLPIGARSIVTLIDSPATIRLIQRELLTSKIPYSAIATKAALASSTVSNIASGATRYPRIETVIRLLGALDWMIYAQRRQP